MAAEFHIDPHTALTADIRIVDQAMLVPFDDKHPRRAPALGGVLTKFGGFVGSSAHFMTETRPQTVAPNHASAKDPNTRQGTWLYGGKHDNRFGHFLVETLARLWALDAGLGDVDGVAFIPKKVMPAARSIKQMTQTRDLFAMIADMPPYDVVTRPTRFDRLIVPPQGCGAGMLAPGCPEFRAFIRNRFATGILPSQLGSKIYVSRTKIRNTPGHILFEDVIEAAAMAEGYEVYHPQDHTLPDQIARYRGASQILGVEGSAFHLIAMANPPSARIGMIRRRQGTAPLGFSDQVFLMTGRPCALLGDVVAAFFIPGTHAMANAVLDLQRLFAQLGDEGFFKHRHDVTEPSEDAIQLAKAALQASIF
ncbi:MAG: glycosyltransferase family 61 protein [Planktomarina sp.]